jgi:2'-5' RNA ligase
MWYSRAAKNRDMFIAFLLPKQISGRLNHIDDLDDDLHLTLIYVQDVDPSERNTVLEAVESVCSKQEPLNCKFVEIGMMGNGSNTLVANVEAMGMSRFYVDLLDEIEERLGRELDRKYDLIPHCTLRYDNDEAEARMSDLRKVSWKANELMVQFGRGNKRHLFPLKG